MLNLLTNRKTELTNKQNSIPPNVYDNPENEVPINLPAYLLKS